MAERSDLKGARRYATACTHTDQMYHANGLCKKCYHKDWAAQARLKRGAIPRMERVVNKCNHRDRAHFAKGMCKSCYGTERSRLHRRKRGSKEQSRTVTACEHINKRHYAKGKCKECYFRDPDVLSRKLEWHKKWLQRNPERYRKLHLAKKFNLSLDRYHEMVASQMGLCAVCANPPATKNGFCVDHCHRTGRVRSLLCSHCNSAIGMLREDSRIMFNAIKYVSHHRRVSDQILEGGSTAWQ